MAEGRIVAFGHQGLEAPVLYDGAIITPPALKRPRRDTVDSSPPPARVAAASGNSGASNELACVMEAPLSQSMDSVNTVATGEDEVCAHGVRFYFPLSRRGGNGRRFLDARWGEWPLAGTERSGMNETDYATFGRGVCINTLQTRWKGFE